MKKLVIMGLYRSPLSVTLWPSSFLKKYGPMIPPAHKAHQTVSFSGCNEDSSRWTLEADQSQAEVVQKWSPGYGIHSKQVVMTKKVAKVATDHRYLPRIAT
ncbi:hypothetical protein TNCV_1670151 [Trichonephila clavipes]|nr:hypothetical protein TNCV_1670151 [Trichonephila clavipes]